MCRKKGLATKWLHMEWSVRRKRGICVCQSGGLLLLPVPHSCHQHSEHCVPQHSNPSTVPVSEQPSSGARKRTANLGWISCPLLKSFTLAGFVFKRKKPLPEPFAGISVLSRSGWLMMPLFSRHAPVRSPAAPTAASCDWCWVGRSQGPNCQLWSLGDSGIKREGERSEVW